MSEATTARWTDGELLLPNELERRQIFYILKRNSSYTAMKRSLGYYQKWADVTEESVRQADEQGLLPKKVYPPGYTSKPGEVVDNGQTSIHYEDYVRILKDLALFDEGVTRLGKGDKRVFTCGDYGLFNWADIIVSYWNKAYHKAFHDHDIRWKEKTPLTKEFFAALDEYCDTGAEAGRYIYESPDQRELRSPAPLSYAAWEAIFLPQLHYPDPLPEVPEPEESIIVKTGKRVPYSGIWEPVMGESSKGWLFKKPQGPFTRVGTMNYLHGGSPAPLAEHIYFDSSDRHGYNYKEFNATWRLIWRDDRYEDGTIPEEEKSYIFVRPLPPGEEDPTECNILKYMDQYGSPFLKGVPQRQQRIPGGQPCPKAGWWFTPAKADSGRYFKEGELMPDFKSDYGLTIWQWLESQPEGK